MNQPLVSIITPVYIDEPEKLNWLSEMIESLQIQTLQDWECILIDDNSPLLLGEVKFKYQSDSRLRWLKTAQNYGPAMTRNSAVTLMTNKDAAIFPLDADDKLGNHQALERLYQTWQQDKTKVVYGHLQVLQEESGIWKTGKVIDLGPYNFEACLKLDGNMPVSCMHSIDAWIATGGWKSTLQFGREDVEYWIGAGKAGYCGERINVTTLIYRKHDSSRDYRLKFVHDKVEEMSNLIRRIHSDVYRGEYPMGCCGRGNNNGAAVQSLNLQSQAQITTLDQFPEDQKLWVEYVGKQRAGFSILGRGTRTSYRVHGLGHKMQVHKDDAQIFKSLDRGRGFVVGIKPPTEEVEQTIAVEIGEYQGGEPALATLERLDTTAEVVIEATPVDQLPTIAEVAKRGSQAPISELDISDKLTEMLRLENWTIESLAEASTNQLTPYPGIGEVRANDIISAAKAWLDQT